MREGRKLGGKGDTARIISKGKSRCEEEGDKREM